MTALTLDPSQARAVELMTAAPLAVVTGGAGVGKTTTLREALDRLDAEGRTYALASPTGKAARRMTEATARPGRPPASTIHRLLGYLGPGQFAHHRGNPLEFDAVFVDEASMVDNELGAALLEAVAGGEARLVLIGDANQLPSVGSGRVFADLIESGRVPVARLTTLHRSAAERWVSSQAPRLLAGELPDLDEAGARRDFRFVECETRDDAAAAAVLAATLAPSAEHTAHDVQVLTPQNNGSAGVDALNVAIRATLMAGAPEPRHRWHVGARESKAQLAIGDRVIQTVNNYLLGVMNGETGRVVSMTASNLVVDLGDRRATYDRDSARKLRLAYALTIHKSQGSEWPWVAVLCHSTHTQMLTRQLLYTAITRSAHGVILIGDRKGLERAVKCTKDRDRNTTLVERLRGELELTEAEARERAERESGESGEMDGRKARREEHAA